MTNIYQRKVKELTIWKVNPSPNARTIEIYNKALAYIMQLYEKLDSELFNQFDGMNKIVWTTNLSDIPCDNALGCAELGSSGGVYSKFYNNPNYDFFIMSMELVHRALAEYYHELNDSNWLRKSNDLPHLAANAMIPPYAEWHTKRFRLLIDHFTLRNPIPVPIFIYNIQYLVNNDDDLISMIKNGSAPTGVNDYWSAFSNIEAKQAIISWLSDYHTLHEHTH